MCNVNFLMSLEEKVSGAEIIIYSTHLFRVFLLSQCPLPRSCLLATTGVKRSREGKRPALRPPRGAYLMPPGLGPEMAALRWRGRTAAPQMPFRVQSRAAPLAFMPPPALLTCERAALKDMGIRLPPPVML